MTPDYATVRSVHVGAVSLSIALFALRGAWMMISPVRQPHRWADTLPHVVDTVLLVSAIWLAWHLDADGARGWLVAKIVALLAYIMLGTIALKRGKTRTTRTAAFAAALATFGYIVSVALTKSPRGFLGWL
jgi:uncharacterized membrane protein SirB2